MDPTRLRAAKASGRTRLSCRKNQSARVSENCDEVVRSCSEITNRRMTPHSGRRARS